ncbi:U-box domain-containing protein 33 [Ananas comosus]|uniref:RING-type E3 ubiquitin transferase n=1 Tax=Ananas comosus TaxID=4615 RepID=A0A199VG16_ANACO|nr:U-box domain-containing protein 33 [Ananas comosus]
MEGNRSWETASNRSGRSSSASLAAAAAAAAAAEGEERVYVAVAEEIKYGKNTLLWALQNVSKDARIVIAHVHVPAQMIPFMGAKFHASKLKPQEVAAYRQLEREKMVKSLDQYLVVCSKVKVKAEKLVIEMDDVAKGLLELISLHGITKLVMGAAADKHYSKKMNTPKSKTAIAVLQKADPSCKIWFVCKGNLIYTKEAGFDAPGIAPSPFSSSSSMSSLSDRLRSLTLPQGQGSTPLSSSQGSIRQDYFTQRSRNDTLAALPAGLHPRGPDQVTLDRRLSTNSSIDPWEGISRRTSRTSSSTSDEVVSNLGPVQLAREEESEVGSVVLPSVHESEEDHFSSPRHELDDMGLDADVYDKLREALAEAENLKNEAFEESRRRRKAEKDVILALQKVKESENLYKKEAKRRKEIEESLAKEMQEIELLKNQRDEIAEQLQKANEQMLALEQQITSSDYATKDLEEKLSAARDLLHSLQAEFDNLQRERDDAVKEAEELRKKREQMSSDSHGALNSEFSLLELKQATQNFCETLKIGEGGFGSVYKGFLRNTTVAIKKLHPESLQGQSEFQQEVAVLSRVRHPNLVTLIGACSEASGLVYEYLPNGSLEDRLVCLNNTPPLTWQVRIRIIGEICSALIFLHSNKPHPVVHGDLKPSNILLDANFISKLSDFGICRLLIQSNTTTTTLYRTTNPRGTFAYMDPEFISTGQLTPRSDIYSFGIIILRLLTGKPPLGIAREVEDAVEDGNLHSMIDSTAGDWPFVQAKQLAHIGLRCAELSRRRRPDLVEEVWRVVEPLMKAASLSASPPPSGSVLDEHRIPSYFVCPIFQEIMRDPHIAADGFTYEAEAIKGWLDSGHDTSPMTNLKLPHCELIPNHALRSAIQEWLQQMQLQL